MLETARGLIQHDWQVTVIVSQPGPLVDVLEDVGAVVTVMPVPVLRKANLSPTGLVALLKDTASGFTPMLTFLREHRPDALYVSTLTIPSWLVIARVLGIPVVCHVHEAEASARAPIRAALAAPTLLATKVVYNSQFAMRTARLPLRRGTGRGMLVHNGVAGPPTEPSDPRMSIDRPALIYVGRLSPRKGVDVAVQALGLLHARGVAAELDLVGAVFAGYEWFEAELRAAVQDLGLENQVRFHGFQNPVWPWLDRADIALVPSRIDEAFGNVLIEAALAARPVIASDHTGLREAGAGRSAAVLVPGGDAAAIADAVQRVIAEWATFRANAIADRPRAEEEYSPARYQEEVVSALASVARRRWSGQADVPGALPPG